MLEGADVSKLQVNRRLKYLSQESIIWKTFLINCKLPLPFLPPTAALSLGNISGSTAEMIVRRAHALEMEWKRLDTHPSMCRFDAANTITALEMLPGGRYLVTAAFDKDDRKFLCIWDLSGARPGHRQTPLARMCLPGLPKEMTVAYLNIKGKMSIVIALLLTTEDEKKYVLDDNS